MWVEIFLHLEVPEQMFLRKVPSVDVDIDGVVTIAGDANVTVLVDGNEVAEPEAVDEVT